MYCSRVIEIENRTYNNWFRSCQLVCCILNMQIYKLNNLKWSINLYWKKLVLQNNSFAFLFTSLLSSVLSTEWLCYFRYQSELYPYSPARSFRLFEMTVNRRITTSIFTISHRLRGRFLQPELRLSWSKLLVYLYRRRNVWKWRLRGV